MKIKFTTAYEESRDSVYGYLLYMTQSRELAEDLSQETFLKIFLHIGSFKGKSSVRTWALKIARNTFLTYARKKQPVLLEEQSIEQEETAYSGQPEKEFLRKEEGEAVVRIMKMLREEERTILLLCDYEEFSYEEIAQIMGLTEDAVKGRIFRARQKFRKAYQEELSKSDCFVCTGKTTQDGGLYGREAKGN